MRFSFIVNQKDLNSRNNIPVERVAEDCGGLWLTDATLDDDLKGDIRKDEASSAIVFDGGKLLNCCLFGVTGVLIGMFEGVRVV